MGCSQGRPSQSSPFERLEKFKMANGYVKGSFADARRSTGQRIINFDAGKFFKNEASSSGSSERTSSRNGASQGKKLLDREVEKRGGEDNNGRSRTSSSGIRESQERKMIMKEEQEQGHPHKGNGAQRIKSKKAVDDQRVDGWPKWLTDNIPTDALAGLTPRSAETYEKIDKVIPFSIFLFMDLQRFFLSFA